MRLEKIDNSGKLIVRFAPEDGLFQCNAVEVCLHEWDSGLFVFSDQGWWGVSVISPHSPQSHLLLWSQRSGLLPASTIRVSAPEFTGALLGQEMEEALHLGRGNRKLGRVQQRSQACYERWVEMFACHFWLLEELHRCALGVGRTYAYIHNLQGHIYTHAHMTQWPVYIYAHKIQWHEFLPHTKIPPDSETSTLEALTFPILILTKKLWIFFLIIAIVSVLTVFHWSPASSRSKP